VESVRASSAAEALELCRQRGWIDVRLHTDDLDSVSMSPSGKNPPNPFTPRTALALRHAGGFQRAILLLATVYRKNLILILIILAVMIQRRVMDKPWQWPDTASVIALALPALLLLFLGRQGTRYRRLQQAVIDARWDDVQSLANALTPTLEKGGP